MSFIRNALIVCAALTAASAAAQEPMTDTVHVAPPESDDLYRDFGGEAVITAVVENFTRIALEDPRIAHTFAESNIDRFTEKLSLQLCWLMGGPCVYDGLGMRESHQPLDISGGEFVAMVEDFQQAMREADVPFRTQNRLLKLLAPMRRDIVAE